MSGHELAARIGDVAKVLYGEPNKRLSTASEMRFGTNGSLRVTVSGDHTGTWRDHESDASGGVLDLVAHKMGGDRKTASEWMRRTFEQGEAASDRSKIVATYPYTDWAGELVHEVVRFEPKDFRQRRPDGMGDWVWNLKGIQSPLYNLPRVQDAALQAGLVFVVEGEKDADRLNGLGLVATCNAGGAGKWRPEHSSQIAGARVVIIPDNDEAGRNHAEAVAAALQGECLEVKVTPLDVADRKGDVSDWLDAGGTVNELLSAVEQAPVWRPSFKPRFPIVWFGSEDEAKPLHWMVRGLLVSAGLSVIFGPPKETKTFVALDLALYIAHSRDWYGLRVSGAGVVYVSGEGSAGVCQRMKAWRQERDGDPGAPFALIPQSVNLFDDPDEVDNLIADLKGMALPMGRPVGLIVLDTLSRMIGGGDEDRARDVNVVVRTAERIQSQTGAHVMIVHHSGKDRDRGMRGSNALLGAVDVAIEVTKDAATGLCQAKVTAIKDGGDVGPFAYTLRQSTVGTDEDGEDIVSCVIDPVGASEGARKPSLTDGERRCLSVLRNLARDSGDMLGQMGRVPFGTWRDKIRDSEEGSFEARKKRAERTTKALIDKGFVQSGYDQVWLEEVV